MKFYKVFLLFWAGTFAHQSVVSQNALINILTQKSGIVHKGEIAFLEVTVNNTDPHSYIGVYKIKVQISAPASIVKIPEKGHVLPTGWAITSNDGSTVILSNGKDMIAANDARTILIAFQATSIGGPSTIVGQLSFSNGSSPGTEPGTLPGDNPSDNSSSSTCKVIL